MIGCGSSSWWGTFGKTFVNGFLHGDRQPGESFGACVARNANETTFGASGKVTAGALAATVAVGMAVGSLSQIPSLWANSASAITNVVGQMTGQTPNPNDPKAPKERRAWSACPNCSRDLGPKPFGSKPPYTYCPFCRVPLSHVWWQRTLVTALALILAFAFPAFLGIRGLTLLFAALVCYFPALVLAMILIFKTIPPKYIRKSDGVTTLFQR